MKQPVAISMAGLLLLTTGCEQASGKAPFSTLSGEMNTPKPKKVVVQDVGEKNIHDQWQGKSNPSLYDGGFFARVDFLYWRADEDGLQYGVVQNINSTASSISSHALLPEIEWGPGFRLGIGYTFSCKDYWDLMALWTHFGTEQSGSKSVNSDPLIGPFIQPWWGVTLLGGFSDHASLHWDLTYNTYDLDLGRNYFVAKTFSVHPFVGVRGATINQEYHAKYHAIFLNPAHAPMDTALKIDTDFWGVGAHIGTRLQWRCTPSFSFLGNIGGSLLYGDFDIKEKYDGLVNFQQSSNATTPVTLTEHLTTGAFNLEALLGLQWEKFFCQNKYRLAITAGYEWSLWFSQNRALKADVVSSLSPVVMGGTVFVRENGNLTLQGANLQVRLDF